MRVREVTVRPVYAKEKSGVRLRDALIVVPYILFRAWLRRASLPWLGRLPGRAGAGRETG